jgi:hypothetical protein
MVAVVTRFVIAATAALALSLSSPAAALASWNWPLGGEVVTPFRNGDDPYAAGQHRGIDIAGHIGASVVAATPGLVRFAGTAGSSGSTVSVRSEDGRFDVSYLHLGSVAVRRGARVAAGEAIGTVGTTGVRSVERPHLHLGVRAAGTRHAYVDPLTLLPPPGTPAPLPPQAVPVAVPAPVRTAPAPAPVPAPRVPALRAPRPAARPLRAPGPSRAPLPAAPARPTGERHALPAPRAAAPSPAPRAHRARPARGAQPGPAPASRAAAAAPAADGARPDGARAKRAPGHGGPDIGWIVACVGLLAAALALPGGRGARLAVATAVPRSRLAALLPALAGRGTGTRE